MQNSSFLTRLVLLRIDQLHVSHDGVLQEFIVLNAEFIVLNADFIVLNAEFIVLNFK